MFTQEQTKQYLQRRNANAVQNENTSASAK